MRKDILQAIAGKLSESIPEIKFIDLWSEQLAMLQSGPTWPVPAVFVEFEQIDWHQMANHARTADIGIRLHVITRCVKYNGIFDRRQVNVMKAGATRVGAALDYLDLLDRINAAMQSLSGENFTSFMHTTSSTGNNLGELMESVERFVTRARDLSAVRKASRSTGLSMLTTEEIIDRVI
ncbi:hypothetical protein Prede_2598 [Prevotella dentalis DSM 3688]|uniref:Uncharacterized protein n=1 Tax=Prevotella dentalis (strain ATCC 49559 / DSM 3688 / JCM 13448 / NCTC 12043 / ES 2772) TaxID=908937 RepID=F9D7A1_PREDD|nr:hypothetical protein [Prevotella dentalis]AGB29737.1 hypothetical protein Prede_2491 [Prevotella dentalis DSM 3688]AGB29832.1 hypothetical protein Prede_2598 [Prevotella dentalis DSM 3688]EGQ11467.1 hypothetical protein HMPREF9136_2729 [Prevotella dentalis DSM 3688]